MNCTHALLHMSIILHIARYKRNTALQSSSALVMRCKVLVPLLDVAQKQQTNKKRTTVRREFHKGPMVHVCTATTVAAAPKRESSTVGRAPTLSPSTSSTYPTSSSPPPLLTAHLSGRQASSRSGPTTVRTPRSLPGGRRRRATRPGPPCRPAGGPAATAGRETE